VVAYVYNCERFVAEMIESVLAQTYRHFDFLFLDDGSTDGTGEIAQRYASDARMRYVRQDRRGRDRLHETFNRCLAESSGELVAIANGDDVMHPEKLARQLALLEQKPHVDVVFHDGQFIDAESNPITGSFLHDDVDPHFLETARFAPFMFGRDLVPNPAAMFRRSLVDRIGLQEYGWAHDYQFWLKAAVEGTCFAYDRERWIHYRVHEDSHSTSSARRDQLTREVQRMRREMRARYSIEQIYPEVESCLDRARATALAHWDLALQLCHGAAFELALEEVAQALAHDSSLDGARLCHAVLSLLVGDVSAARTQLRALIERGFGQPAVQNLALLERRESQGYQMTLPPDHELFRRRRGPRLARGGAPLRERARAPEFLARAVECFLAEP